MSVFLDIVDRIIQLIKARDERQVRLFSEIIDPLFRSLQPVVENQLRIFKDALALLDAVHETVGAADLIWHQRSEHLLSRVYAREMARLLKEEYANTDIELFANEILNLFRSGIRPKLIRHDPLAVSSDLIVLCDLFLFLEYGALEGVTPEDRPVRERSRRQEVPYDELRDYIQFTIGSIESRWADVCYRYAIVQHSLLLSPRAWRRRSELQAAEPGRIEGRGRYDTAEPAASADRKAPLSGR